ncbi:MAG: hypothetical protein P8M11_04130 [Planctomycetota bacterium]|nr:hypothetical protein [Planctomycetota bacterium]
MKLIATIAVAGSAVLFWAGALPCPCELSSALCAAYGGGSVVASEGAPPAGRALQGAAPCAEPPTGLYLEVRNATVWGGACHIGSEAVSQGTYAAAGWAFDGGSHQGVSLMGVRVVSVIQGSSNLQAEEVFRAGGVPSVRSVLWVDAPDQRAADAAVAHVRGQLELGTLVAVERSSVQVTRVGDAFELRVPGVLAVEGDALPDRSCCTMPESLWYSPLAPVSGAVVGNPSRCRFHGVDVGAEALSPWAFEGENSAFVARLGA